MEEYKNGKKKENSNKKKSNHKEKIKLNKVNDLIKIPVNELLSIDVNILCGNLYKKIYEEAIRQENKKHKKNSEKSPDKNIKKLNKKYSQKISDIKQKKNYNTFQKINQYSKDKKDSNHNLIRKKSFDKIKNKRKKSISSDEEEYERKKSMRINKNQINNSFLSRSDKNMKNNFNQTYYNNFYSNLNVKRKLNFEINNNNYIINYTPFKKRFGDEENNNNISLKENNKDEYNNNFMTGDDVDREQNFRNSKSNSIYNSNTSNNNINNSKLIKRFYSGMINLKNNLNIIYNIRRINFVIKYISSYGEDLGILGSIYALGNWEHNKVIKLKWNNGHIWKGGIYVNNDSIKYFEFKFVLLQNNKIKKWESGENNKFNYEMFYNELKNKKNGFYDKYNYDYNFYNEELTLNCKWNA